MAQNKQTNQKKKQQEKKKNSLITQQQCLFPEIMTWLVKKGRKEVCSYSWTKVSQTKLASVTAAERKPFRAPGCNYFGRTRTQENHIILVASAVI